MTNPHYSMARSTGDTPVRPGTSAALTARTIDATIHPPLVRATEAVAAIIPSLSLPPAAPLLIGSFGLSLVILAVTASRMRLRPSVVLMSALMLLPVSSYHAVPKSARPQPAPAEEMVATSDYPTTYGATVPGYGERSSGYDEPSYGIDMRGMEQPEEITTSSDDEAPPEEATPDEPVPPEIVVPSPPQTRDDAPEMMQYSMPPELRRMYEDEHVRAAIESLRRELRTMARRQYHRRYQTEIATR